MQVCTVVTKRSVTLDPTTNQSVSATQNNTPPCLRTLRSANHPPPPSKLARPKLHVYEEIANNYLPTPSNNVLRTLRSANSPPPPSKLAQPKLQDKEPEYAVPVRETRVERGGAKPASPFMQNAHKKPPDPLCPVPLYDKVNPDQQVVVESLSPRQSAHDNDIWAQFKFPILPVTHSNEPKPAQAEHVYDEIADNYLSPVKQRKVSVTEKFIYKECCTTCGFVNAKVAC